MRSDVLWCEGGVYGVSIGGDLGLIDGYVIMDFLRFLGDCSFGNYWLDDKASLEVSYARGVQISKDGDVVVLNPMLVLGVEKGSTVLVDLPMGLRSKFRLGVLGEAEFEGYRVALRSCGSDVFLLNDFGVSDSVRAFGQVCHTVDSFTVAELTQSYLDYPVRTSEWLYIVDDFWKGYFIFLECYLGFNYDGLDCGDNLEIYLKYLSAAKKVQGDFALWGFSDDARRRVEGLQGFLRGQGYVGEYLGRGLGFK